jgi:hypothetical protein
MTAYPSSLPLPQIEGYQVAVTIGTSGVQFENGNSRRRRSARQERHVFSMALVLSVSDLWDWQSWANEFGYDWHYLNLTTSFAGFTTGRTLPHYIRYIGDISIEPVSASHVRVSFQAEMDLNTLPLGIIEQTGNVYVAGTPASPSSSNTIRAGTPASPSTDQIIAGTPGLTA